MYTELAAPVTIGRIHVGAEFGGSATVMVPEVCVPVASAGTLPNCPCRPMLDDEPDELVPLGLLLLLLLLQAASAVMLATARATPAIVVLRNFIIGPPSVRCSRLWSVLGSSACRPSLAVCR